MSKKCALSKLITLFLIVIRSTSSKAFDQYATITANSTTTAGSMNTVTLVDNKIQSNESVTSNNPKKRSK